jgi:hypothetical protein
VPATSQLSIRFILQGRPQRPVRNSLDPDIIVTTGGRVTPVFMQLTRSIPMMLCGGVSVPGKDIKIIALICAASVKHRCDLSCQLRSNLMAGEQDAAGRQELIRILCDLMQERLTS